MVLGDRIPADFRRMYEVHDYRHAAAILAGAFTTEPKGICVALRSFNFTEEEVERPGGNESDIPKRFSQLLRSAGWKSVNLTARRTVDDRTVTEETQEIDYVKGPVALDLEWNSKDQTFDRDLQAFRAFFECDKISVGVLITRSNELDPWFDSLGTYRDKHDDMRT
jgi:hypothetical protein